MTEKEFKALHNFKQKKQQKLIDPIKYTIQFKG